MVGGGWTAVVFDTGRIGVARVSPAAGARPRLQDWRVFAREGTDVEALKRLRGAHQVGAGPCVTVLRHSQYRMLQVEAPEVPEEEFRDALRWRIKDMVDFPVEQSGIDFLPVPAAGARGAGNQLSVVVASHEVLAPQVRLFQDAGVRLDAIDVPELAQRNVAALLEDDNRALALLAFDGDGGRLTFTYGGELCVSRHVDANPEALAAGDTGPGGLYERVLLDVQRSLDNFDRNYSAISLSRLVVAPPAGAPGFVDYLKGNLYQAVESLDLGQALDLAEVPVLADPVRQGEALIAIGAALRTMEADAL